MSDQQFDELPWSQWVLSGLQLSSSNPINCSSNSNQTSEDGWYDSGLQLATNPQIPSFDYSISDTPILPHIQGLPTSQSLSPFAFTPSDSNQLDQLVHDTDINPFVNGMHDVLDAPTNARSTGLFATPIIPT